MHKKLKVSHFVPHNYIPFIEVSVIFRPKNSKKSKDVYFTRSKILPQLKQAIDFDNHIKKYFHNYFLKKSVYIWVPVEKCKQLCFVTYFYKSN